MNICITPCIYNIICTDAITEALSNRTMVTTVNSSVILSCEVYGYLPRGSQRQINWRRTNGGSISSSIPPYTLSTSNGSRQIQNGGISPIPSLVSSLTIDVMDASVADMYTCSSPSDFETIQLIMDVDKEGMYNKSYLHWNLLDLLTS